MTLKKIAGASVLIGLLTGCSSITPTPLSTQEIQTVIRNDKPALYADQERVTTALSLGDVMARALHYNLDYRAQRMSDALALGQFDLVKYEMLPTLAAEAGYLHRNNQNASRSISIFNGTETLEPSTSQQKDRRISSMRFSWNILDFGVSYFQARQEADRVLINNGNRRKLMMSLLHETQAAYWNALAAQQLEQPVSEALANARAALNDINRGLKARAYAKPVDALRLKKHLLESVGELETLSENLENSKIYLANLINLPAGTPLMLEPVSMQSNFTLLDIPMDDLELTALSNSTDLAEQMYNLRIEQFETRKALLRLLPGIELAYDHNFDSNKFLYNESWSEAGVHITWNLMRLASTATTLDNAELREMIAKQKRLTVTMAVITQLNLALQQLSSSERNLVVATELKDIDETISRHTNQKANNSASVVEKVQAKVAELKTRMGYLQAVSDAQVAKGSVYVALGLSPVPQHYEAMDVSELAQNIEQTLTDWSSVGIPVYELPAEEPSEPVAPANPS